MVAQSIELKVSIAERISLAFHQNAFPIVSEIALSNLEENELRDLTVQLRSEPSFFQPAAWTLEVIVAGGVHHISLPDLRLDPGKLARITESVRAEVILTASRGEEQLACSRTDVELLPPSHWGGVNAAPELLSAFVRPNDPAIDLVLRDAATALANAGRATAIDGYTSKRKARAWEIAEAIWIALAARGITYVLPPASFERVGQKVRSPSDIIDRRVGTCLDLSLLYAACAEQAGLNPLLVLTTGHAFVGLWLKDEDFSSTVVEDVQVLRKRRSLDEVVFIETTLLTTQPSVRFAAAVQRGGEHLIEEAKTPFEVAIDIRRARARQIRPLDLGMGPLVDHGRSTAPSPRSLDFDDVPNFAEEVVVAEEADQRVDRLEKWKRRLLDLTLRNKLLSFKDTKKSIVLECPDPAKLEDMLASGKTFKLLPRTDVLDENDQRSAELFIERHHDDGRQRYVLQALERGDLHTRVSEKELDARLTELFRLTRTSFEEGGSNILFLAMGFLQWTQKEGAPPCKAPILLIPVSLQRSSVRAGFRLALHEDEARFNPTLLELLRQDFDLRMPKLEGELPTDESGLDVASIWRIVRTHIRDLPGWEVTENVILSTFSFTKYLMWKDLHDRTELLKRNPVVRHLIETPTESYGDASDFPDAMRLDLDYRPAEIFAPLSADSSQLAAVLAAQAGKDFVLFGPPGTGKSQTIANIIAQCLAHQRTVLFVSQKTAALEVVQRRLRDIGLGEYCLEVHSTKVQKSAVLGQLKTAWHERKVPTSDEWEGATANLQALRDELNELVSALHRRRNNGMTAYEAFGRSVSYRDRFTKVSVGWPNQDDHSEASLATLRAACRNLKTAMLAVGDVASHPLRGIDAFDWSPAWRSDMLAAIDDLAARLPELGRAGATFGALVGLDAENTDPQKLSALGGLAGQLLKPQARAAHPLLTQPDGSLSTAVMELRHLQETAKARRLRLVGRYDNGLSESVVRRLIDDWAEASRANILVRGSRQRRVLAELKTFARGPLPPDPSYDLAILLELASLEEKASQLGPALGRFGAAWQGLATSVDQLENLMNWAYEARRICDRITTSVIDSAALRERIGGLFIADPGCFEAGSPAGAAGTALQTALSASANGIERLTNLIGTDAVWKPIPGKHWLDSSLATMARWKSNISRAPAWAGWKAASSEARDRGLAALVDGLESGELTEDEIEQAFDVAYARWWIDRIVTEDRTLRGFLAVRHQDTIDRFRAADAQACDLAKRIVRARLGGGVPPPTAFGSDPEWGTLARELVKKTRHMPLRQLFGRIPTALTRLTPCVMMSPLSIAQYLPAEAQPFDVVLFDEASQIPVWDAVGAIARGRQVIVVGDPQQLPPTSVGERGVDDVEDGTDVTDQESILDECLASNIPHRRLDWHYRSRHESLIAFSNHAYYTGKLVTFPSPVTEDRAVRYVAVPGGVYERGTGRVNREEARSVVADVVRRLKEPGFTIEKRSIGIVTFNGEQQRLIENLLDQERRSHPELESFFDPTRWHEPVFVKNLENVQGDERDVILFSVAVGPDENGRTVAQVSSLNRDGGHRRLNVAITRARRELVVFATLRPEQIDLSRTNARGVRDFKHFLEYAQRGARAIAEAFTPTGLVTESPFEDAVKAALEARDWEVHPQVGVSSFRVDLGVVHPDAPGRYLAGIECDGATYHRSATARDRDRLREMILTDLGWTIHRVWSPDWWNDADQATDMLHQRLLANLQEDRQHRGSQQEAVPVIEVESTTAVEADPADGMVGQEEDDDTIQLDEPLTPIPMPPLEPHPVVYAKLPISADNGLTQAAPVYLVADIAACGLTLDPERFYDPLYRSTLRTVTSYVINQEGPVFDDVVIRRIARAHGFARTGRRIHDAVLKVIGPRFPRTWEGDRTVLWSEGSIPGKLAEFRSSENGTRDHNDVPLVELASLAQRFLSGGADEEEALRLMASHFGLGRLREATKVRFSASIAWVRS